MDTIVALATPRGAGALAILRLSGGRAKEIALEMLRGAPALEPRRAVKATIFDQTGDLDSAVVTYFPASSSPTGEDLVELTVHGSVYVVDRALARARQRARPAAPGEFTQRAFLNGKLDLAQAEAVCDLIRARGEAAHRAALNQLEGGLSRKIQLCREPLLELLVRVEACLDHPEEDIPSLTQSDAAAALTAIELPIRKLVATFERGRLAADGARLTLVGLPNAGKSSLLNALLGKERAIVCAEPGTTRDTLEEATTVAGMPTVLIDTAGVREASGPAERAGIERSRAALRGCDAAILVVDGSRRPSAQERLVHEEILKTAANQRRPVVTAVNKCDLGSFTDAQWPEPVSVSAKLGTGLEELRERLARRLGFDQESEPALVTCARHHDALVAALEELAGARSVIASMPGRWEDRAASHLREGARQLGLVLGENAPDEVLHAVFSRFCVGK